MTHDPICPTFRYPDDHCQCRLIAKVREDERERRNTEDYWRARIAEENTERRRRAPVGSVLREDDRKPERDAIARAIADSEAFMWLMVGANHPDAHLRTLREAWNAYSAVDGGFGRWQRRTIPMDPAEVTAVLNRFASGATPTEVMTGMTTEELDALGGEPK